MPGILVGLLISPILIVVIVRRGLAWKDQMAFNRTAVAAEGTVVDLVAGGGAWWLSVSSDNLAFHGYSRGFGATRTGVMFRGQVPHFPVVQFRAADGSTVKFADSLGSVWTTPHNGDRVSVRYDPADPTRAQIAGNEATGSWLAGGVLICIALGAVLTVPFLIVAANGSNARNQPSRIAPAPNPYGLTTTTASGSVTVTGSINFSVTNGPVSCVSQVALGSVAAEISSGRYTISVTGGNVELDDGDNVLYEGTETGDDSQFSADLTPPPVATAVPGASPPVTASASPSPAATGLVEVTGSLGC